MQKILLNLLGISFFSFSYAGSSSYLSLEEDMEKMVLQSTVKSLDGDVVNDILTINEDKIQECIAEIRSSDLSFIDKIIDENDFYHEHKEEQENPRIKKKKLGKNEFFNLKEYSEYHTKRAIILYKNYILKILNDKDSNLLDENFFYFLCQCVFLLPLNMLEHPKMAELIQNENKPHQIKEALKGTLQKKFLSMMFLFLNVEQ